MKCPRLFFFAAVLLLAFVPSEAQKRRFASKSKISPNPILKSKTAAGNAMVIDESLSVLRSSPSLFAASVQRMRRGRRVKILETKQADGVTFYRVAVPPNNSGWLQSEAVFGDFRRGDDERLAGLIQASKDFEKIELAVNFLELFPNSALRPAILLLLGDLAEEAAVKLSRDATRRLDRREMAASGAPLHSYYLNFARLDRYRKMGIVYLFDPQTKLFHYDGASWREIVKKFPNANEKLEAQKRIDSLKSIFEEITQ